MIRKLTLAIGFGAGYVLGAKAGTQRYQEIVGKAREVAGMPAVQDATAKATSAASAAADVAKSKATDAKSAVQDKVSSSDSSGSGTDIYDATVVDLSGHGAETGLTPRAGAAPSVTAPDLR